MGRGLVGRCGAAGPLALALLGCSAPPGATDPDAAAPFAWAAVVDGTGEALLSTCGEDDQILAVGGGDGRGFVVQWTGQEWYAPSLPAGTSTLWWCWSGGGEATAVGERAVVLRRDVGDWTRDDAGGAIPSNATLYGVWSDGATVWAVGGEPTAEGARPVIARRDGGGWAAIDTVALPGAALFKVWGSSAGDVWAVGTGGIILHFDGAAWTAAASPTTERLIAVWGTAADDVYAVGGDGIGLVLRWDGTAWAELARTPEPLSGLWRAPGGPLYVGGNRGWLGRFAAPGGGPADAAMVTSSAPFADVDVHAMHGSAGSVFAAGADLLGGGDPSWRGRLLVHGGGFGGDLERPPDAGPSDASTDDGGADASTAPGPGEPCGSLPDVCAPGLECWLLLESDEAICTQYCDTPADCGADYGPDPCCELPGFQALDPVCIPGDRAECTP